MPRVSAHRDNRLSSDRGLLAQRLRTFAQDGIPANPSGFTYDLRRGCRPRFDDDVYIVSLYGHEFRSPHRPSTKELTRWAVARAGLLLRPIHFLGGWFNLVNDMFYLDISIPVRGIARAQSVGRQQLQSAVYHPASGQTIWVPQIGVASGADDVSGRW